ncbi:MAG: InlB B-repeat-containing protein, partial [Ruminococcus sp.]|nr:InlB B-repeat-containing protein [Ruminococcus sp.]
WDGTVLSTQSVAYGSAATAPATPTRPATAQYSYTFSGWDKSFSKITGNLTVTAQYTTTTNKYTVTFVNWDGTVLSTQSVAYGSAATAPATPTRPATAQYTYTFKAWDKSFSNITGNLTVTATYSETVNKYTVSFVDWDGTVLKSDSVEYGSAATAPADPTRDGYEFSGWDTDYSYITGDLTVTAKYNDVQVYLVGDFNQWATDTIMTKTSGDIVSTTIHLEPANYTFKILTRDVWYGNYGTIVDTTLTTSDIGWEMVDGAGNCTLTAFGGDYTFNYNTSTRMLEVLYSPDRFTVTFFNWDGTVLKSDVVMKGQSATAPEAPTREGDAQYSYTFAGWDKSFSNIQATTDITATFTQSVNEYTVTFTDWNGTVLSTQSVAYGSSATAPKDPTRAATAQYTYTFTGWDKSFDNVTENITVNATYSTTVNKYTVTFVNYDGTVLSTQSVEYGSAATAPADPTRPATAQNTYTFTGWDKSFSSVTGDLTVTAQYTTTTNKYTVTFVNWDGTVLSTQNVAYGSAAKAPADPTREATAQYTYTFSGWDKSFSNITGDLTVTAKYTAVVNKYTVTFTDWDGTVLKSDSVEYGSAATAPSAPTRAATAQYTYTFSGWDKSFSNITGNLTVTAKYTATVNKYTVTFVDWDGTVLKSDSVEYGSAATAPAAPTRDGYEFTCWDIDFTSITSTITVTAQYVDTAVYLLGDFNGWATDTVMTSTAGDIVSVTLELEADTYLFKILTRDVWYGNYGTIEDTTITTSAIGWEMIADADNCTLNASGGTYTFNYNTSTRMLEVLYEPDEFTVTFVDWDGTVLSTQSVRKGSAAIAPETPTRAGDAQYSYTFAGWDTDFSDIQGNITVTATYTETVNKYTVEFVDHDGTVLYAQSVEYGSAATAPAAPTRDGYEFTGWDTDFSNITTDTTVTAQYRDIRVFLLGDFNYWSTDTVMTKISDDVVSVTLSLEPDTYLFKILTQDQWYGNNGTIENTTTATSAIGWRW